MQTQSTLTNPRSRKCKFAKRFSTNHRKENIIYIANREPVSLLISSYQLGFAIVLGLTSSNTNDTAPCTAPCLFSCSSLLRINIHIASARLRRIRAKHLHIVSKVRNF